MRLPEYVEKGLAKPQWCFNIPQYAEIMARAEKDCKSQEDNEDDSGIFGGDGDGEVL